MPRTAPNKLTPKQGKILTFVIKYGTKQGYSPSIREIGDQFEIRSTNGVFDHLNAIERKGFIRRDRNQARSIVVLKDASGDAFRTPFEKEVEGLLVNLEADSPSAALKKQIAKIRRMLK